MKLCKLLLITLPLFLFACAESVSRNPNSRILAMGDSLLATNQLTGQSITDTVEKKLGVKVIDRSVMGARILYGLPISGSLGLNITKQYRPSEWDWVILNGGGNDLWLGCGCILCDRKMNRLIAKDGSKGEIPKLVSKIRKSGAQVIYVGYLRSPGVASFIDHCRNEGNELESRIDAFANTDEGVHFLSLKELVPNKDRSFHAPDMIHPSVKASKTIGALIAEIIQP